MVLKQIQKAMQWLGWAVFILLAVNGLISAIGGKSFLDVSVGLAQPDEQAAVDNPQSSVPLYLDYEGYLTDMDGAPLTGYYTVTLRIYEGVADPIGSELWTEVHPNVPVRDGRFSVLLGNTTALPESLFDLPDRFIGATVAPFDELVPRQRLASVPYAVHADHAASLNAPDGSPMDAVFVDEIGNVGVGTTNPTYKLDVFGDTLLEGNLDVVGNVQLQGNLEVTGNSSIGPHFIEPVIVATGDGTVAWTTFEVSAYIPTNTTAIILEAEASMSTPDTGDDNAHIRIRRNNLSSSYLLLRGRPAGGPDDIAWASQGIFPIDNLSFQYTVEPPGFDLDFTIRLIGYFK